MIMNNTESTLLEAMQATKADLASGKFKVISVKDHIRDLQAEVEEAE